MDLTPKRPVEIEVHVDGSVVTVRLTGRLTVDSDFDSLRETFDGLLAQSYHDFVLDLRDVRLIDSAGLGEIVQLSLRVDRQGGVLMVEGARWPFPIVFNVR